MSVPGAFFEVTGKESELFRIIEAIADNDGRLTASSSASLDLWQEMLEEWFRIHDNDVAASELEALPYALTGAWKGRKGPTTAEAIEYIRSRAAEIRDEK